MAWEQLGWAALLLPTVLHASWCASSSSCGNQSRSALHISHLPPLHISHLPLPLDNALLMAEAGPRLKSISNSAYVTSANIIGQSKFVHPWPKSMDRKKLHLLWRSRRDCKVPWKGCVMVIAILVSMKQYFIVVLTCIFLMINDVEHFLGASVPFINISFLQKYLFNYFAHF